ncbi:MAG: hypothetical protein J0G30_11335 [Actinomycetales bacterium]|nr:hypothetical protein [Actinomycetales bacterium]
MAECIHGFDIELCDICTPREPVGGSGASRGSSGPGSRGGRSAPARREPTSRPRRTAPTTRPGSIATSSTPALVFSSRRVFHITHERNLEQMLLDGAIVPGATPDLDVSSATTRELRASADAPDGAPVAAHAAYYLSADASRWVELRSGAAGSHWSDAARRASASEFVVLSLPATALGAEVILADGDAAGVATRFAQGPDAATAALRRIHASDPDFLEVEALTLEPVPLGAVVLLAVANEPARERVRAAYAALDRTPPKIGVHPPWFAGE